jgi:hypothetical protein
MMSNGTAVFERPKRKPVSTGGRPRYALFNIFLPEIDDLDRLGALQEEINALVAGTGASGYTLLPPSTGFWVHDGSMVEDRVFPMQIVAEDNERTRRQIEQFAADVAELLGEQWLFVYRVPVTLNAACQFSGS